MRNFIVASHGQTATKWFAKALDLHPQINCSHGYYYPPLAANDPRSEMPVAEQRRVTEERFFKRPEGLSLEEYFNELDELGRGQQADLPVFNGSVHCFTAAMMFNQLRTDRADGLVWMNMVRHPIDRINSVVAHWTNILVDDERFRKHLFECDLLRCRHLIELISEYHDVDFGTVQNALFIVALLQLQDIHNDLKACLDHHVPIIVQERLVSDRSYFRDIAVHLTRDEIEISKDYLDRIFAMPKINTHQLGSREWVEWEKYGFGLVMTEDVRLLYCDLGYAITSGERFQPCEQRTLNNRVAKS